MPTKKADAAEVATLSESFSPEERAAMRQRAAELRAEGKQGAKRADGLEALFASIAAMTPQDRELAEHVHRTVTAVAPGLTPKTYYGMPAYATEGKDGKVIGFFKPKSKFKVRYSTVGFQPDARLDDGDMWATEFAVIKLTPTVESRIAELVKKAAG